MYRSALAIVAALATTHVAEARPVGRAPTSRHPPRRQPLPRARSGRRGMIMRRKEAQPPCAAASSPPRRDGHYAARA